MNIKFEVKPFTLDDLSVHVQIVVNDDGKIKNTAFVMQSDLKDLCMMLESSLNSLMMAMGYVDSPKERIRKKMAELGATQCAN